MLNWTKLSSFAVIATWLGTMPILAAGPGTPMIDFPQDADIAACRAPSTMPQTVQVANADFPCRQLKIVQHWLGAMSDPRNSPLEPDDIPGVGAKDIACLLRGPLPEEEDPNDPFGAAPCHPLTINPEIRREALFGPTWERQLQLVSQGGNCDTDCYRTAVEEFDSTLRSVFDRLFALLVAASIPLDHDDDLNGEDWWWELPGVYADEPDRLARQTMMVEDVNAWIQSSGIWVFTAPGTPNKFHDDFFDNDPDLNKVGNIGDYDFHFSALLHFLYSLKDRTDLLHDESVRVLIQKNWTLDDDPGKQPFLKFLNVEPVEWLETAIPFSGQGFAAEMVSINHAKKIELGLSETENHVLMALTHYYLINQWIEEDYRGNMQDVAAPGLPAGETIESWYATASTPLEQAVRDALARVVHADLFETNARPYQHHAIAPIFVLATHAENPSVRTEAENALHFLASKFTFQSLDGRRSTPMRRNCGYADSLTLYNQDGAALGFGILTGAYKWNDSAYGLRRSLTEPGTCFEDRQDCHYDRYTWKVDEAKDDSHGEHIAATPEELGNDRIDPGGQIKNLLIAFSGYRVPRPLHAFLLDRDRRHYARMMSRYDDDVYRPSRNAHTGNSFAVDGPFEDISETELRADELAARYFSGGVLDDSSINNERVPEFYFHGPGFVNAGGGTYNAYLYRIENSYLIERNPYPLLGSCTGADRSDEFLENTENYDFLSRPYMVLPDVPTVFDTQDEDADGDTTEPLYYRPFGLSGEVVFFDDNPETPDDEHPDTVDLLRYVPMMRGNQNEWYKSVNSATFKNFSYGYRIRKDGSTIGTYAMLGWEWPLNLPPDWQRCLREVDDLQAETDAPEEVGCPDWVPRRSFQFGALGVVGDVPAARFELYDLRAFLNASGQRGYIFVTAKLRKSLVEFWSERVARGLWEVIPEDFPLISDVGDPIEALALVEDAIRDGNDPDWMRLNYTGKRKHFSYRLVTSGDVVRLSQYYGGVFDGQIVNNEGRVQGIIGATDPDGDGYDLANVFQRFMDNDIMNNMPLIDVKAVDERFRFVEDVDGLLYYACARDGWLYVNNPRDGSWLFADSRRSGGLPEGDPGTPFWLAGSFEEDGDWTPKPSCGFGSGGDWVPAPPSNGVTETCSGDAPCPQPAGQEPERPVCTSSMTMCATTSQCPSGQRCVSLANGSRTCQCPPQPRADLRPVPVLMDHGIEGLPGLFFCAAVQVGNNGLSRNVVVGIENVGSAPSAASQLRIDFRNADSLVVPVGPLEPGEQIVRTPAIPNACYSPGTHCNFDMMTDAADAVPESNEVNNSRASICLHPAG